MIAPNRRPLKFDQTDHESQLKLQCDCSRAFDMLYLLSETLDAECLQQEQVDHNTDGCEIDRAARIRYRALIEHGWTRDPHALRMSRSRMIRQKNIETQNGSAKGLVCETVANRTGGGVCERKQALM
jgi:hypothetical protein